ncbi:hypothetical protein [Roseivirga echinicomitans]|uniref:Phytase-like domain-containing protein n=1 Tax=Roseivirga echinicomitans TaxID=296218 RepID=A0A150X179_9BACT|nr:hypothetical protein [Roseivirga echinicomitans]KYG72493.1 hypothetical protein AWN68_12095 [Roseivirga echinicomitans]
MKRIGLIVIILLFVSLYFVIDYDSNNSSSELIKPVIDETGIRTFKMELVLLKPFNFPDGKSVFRIFSDGANVWGIDNNQEVILIENYGNKVNLGLVKSGGAPFENSQLSSVRNFNGNLHMVDIEKNTIRSQIGLDSIVDFRKLLTPIYNGVPVKDDRYLTITDEGPQSSLQLISVSDAVPIWSKELMDLFELESTDFPEIVAEGVFTYNQKQTFYVPGRIGAFATFSEDGSLNYIAKTIDKTQAPKVFTKQILKGFTAQMFVREPDFYVNYSASADDRLIYILSKFKLGRNDDFMTVDTYEVHNGGYFTSFAVPNLGEELPIEIAVLDNNLFFVLYENYSVAVFEIHLKTEY